MCVDAEVQKCLMSLELEVQAVVGCLMWVLGIEKQYTWLSHLSSPKNHG